MGDVDAAINAIAELDQIALKMAEIIMGRAVDLTNETIVDQVTNLSETAATYRASLRSPVRGLWKGVLDINQAFEMFDAAVRRGLTQAWHDGLKQVGITPAEQTPQERMTLANAIASERQFIFRFLLAVEQNSEANGGKLGPQMNRSERWVPRYNQLRNEAIQMAGQDQKFKFVINPAKENCRSCLKVAGKVKRMSSWRAANIRPQGPNLECMMSAGGPVVCGCEFRQTDEPLTRGPLPRMP